MTCPAEPLPLLDCVREFTVTMQADLLYDDPTVGQRYPVLRTGEREEIDEFTRWLIWHRDGGRCQICTISHQPLQLDHLIPWSAGGADDATNLRLLCEPCNQERSNVRRWEHPRLLPVSGLCDSCVAAHVDGDKPHGRRYGWYCPGCTGQIALPTDSTPIGTDFVGTRAYCGSCRAVSIVSDPERLR